MSSAFLSLSPLSRRVGAPDCEARGWRPTCRRMGPRSLRLAQLPSYYRPGSLARLPCRLHTRRRRLVNRLGPRELLTPPRPAHISTEPRAGTLSAGLASVLRVSMLRAGVPMARAPRKPTDKRTGHAFEPPSHAFERDLCRSIRRSRSRRRSSPSRRLSRRCSRPSQRTAWPHTHRPSGSHWMRRRLRRYFSSLAPTRASARRGGMPG